MFGQQPTQPLFGAPQAGGGLFGQPPQQPAPQLFGQPGQTQTGFGQQPVGQPTLGQPAFGQAAPLFGQQQQPPAQPTLQPLPTFGQPAFGQPTLGQTTFGQPTLGMQQQTNPLFSQQQQTIQFQNYLPPTFITQTIRTLPEMQEDLRRKKERVNYLYDEINHAKTILPQNFQSDLENRLKLNTLEVLQQFQRLEASQRSLMAQMDELLTALGLVDRYTQDGNQMLREENTYFRELQQAEQTLNSTELRLQMSANRYQNQAAFSLPQPYEYQIIQRLNRDIEALTQAVIKLEQFNPQMLDDNQDFDELIDQHLERKLSRLANLSNLLHLLQQKVRHIQSRVDSLRNKSFSVLYPEKNKRLNEYHSIDLALDQLESIRFKEMKSG